MKENDRHATEIHTMDLYHMSRKKILNQDYVFFSMVKSSKETGGHLGLSLYSPLVGTVQFGAWCPYQCRNVPKGPLRLRQNQ